VLLVASLTCVRSAVASSEPLSLLFSCSCIGWQAMDVLDEFMQRHSSTSKGIMAIDKNLSDQQKKKEGRLATLLSFAD